jgi:hypothetical protein
MGKPITPSRRSGEMAKANNSCSVPRGEKYQGKYVATKSFNHGKVIASGNDPIKVRQRAIENGAKSPVVVYVPKSTMIYIF